MKTKNFKFLAWEINLKIRHMSVDERILYLANRLIDEAENNGYVFGSSVEGLNVLRINNWPQGGRLEIESLSATKNAWCIKGNRKFKEVKDAEI